MSPTSLYAFYSRLAGFIGNLLEHYDAALFGFLAPFLAPLFFENYDPLTALILTYGILPLGILTRPLGALFFGRVGDFYGRRQALFLSLTGMALTTVGMGCLPTYSHVGVWAPLFLMFGRMLQSFFAAGETTGAAIFILENSDQKKLSAHSGLYGASTLAGMLLASLLVTSLSSQNALENGWRVLFWLGGVCGFVGLFVRWYLPSPEGAKVQLPKADLKLLNILKTHKRAFLWLMLAAGFSYTTYALPFTLMNGYVPMIANVSKAEAMQYNSYLLVMDMCLLPLFGWLADRFGKEKIMLMGAVGACLGALPLFSWLEGANLTTIIAVRFYIVICGVAFAAPYYAWSIQLVPSECRYTLLALSSAIGSQLVGSSSSAICLWLYQKTAWVCAPGLYLMLVALAGIYAIWKSSGVEVLTKAHAHPIIHKS